MDDEEVSLDFTADVEEAVAAVGELRDSAQELAATAEEAQTGLDGLRDSSAEAATAVNGIRDATAEADAGASALRDGAAEAAASLAHLRDEAAETAVALDGVRDAEVEAGAAGAAESAGGMSMMAVAMTGLVGAAAAVAPAVAAVGGSFGALGVFAMPIISEVTNGMKTIAADQKAVNAATTDAAKSKALQKLHDDYAQLGVVMPVINGIQQLKTEIGSLATTSGLQDNIISLMTQALQIAKEVLPEIVPLAKAGAGALGQLLSALGTGLKSPEFIQFLDMLAKLAGPAMTALLGLGQALGGILISALEQLAPLSVPFIQMLTQLLTAAGPGLVGALQLIANTLIDVGRAITPLIGPLSKVLEFMGQHPIFAQMAAAIIGIVAAVKLWTLAQAALDVVLDANPIGLILLAVAALVLGIIELVKHWHDVTAAFATAGHAIASAFDAVRHTVASWGHDIASAFDAVRHAIASAVDAVISWLSGHWKLILSILLDPIGTFVMELRAHWNEIAHLFDEGRHEVASILDGLRHDIASWFDNVRHDLAAFADWVPHEIASLWDKAVQLNLKALDILRHDIATAFDDVRHSVAAGIDAVLQFFEKLPGQVVSFLVALPGQMLQIGENVIKGLINGIVDAAKSIPSIMSGLASSVASYFTDPLKLFSPSRLFYEHGWNIVQGAINGVKANAPQLLDAMRNLGGGVAGTGSALAASAAAPAGSTSVHVNVPVTAQGVMTDTYSSPQFQQFMQRTVQEAILRYGQVNVSNGLTPAWGR